MKYLETIFQVQNGQVHPLIQCFSNSGACPQGSMRLCQGGAFDLREHAFLYFIEKLYYLQSHRGCKMFSSSQGGHDRKYLRSTALIQLYQMHKRFQQLLNYEKMNLTLFLSFLIRGKSYFKSFGHILRKVTLQQKQNANTWSIQHSSISFLHFLIFLLQVVCNQVVILIAKRIIHKTMNYQTKSRHSV